MAILAAMLHRVATIVLTVAIALAGVALAPCSSGALCPSVGAQQMDCCKGPPPGISAGRCCNGSQQVRQAPPPATSERSLQRTLMAPAMLAMTVDPPVVAPPQLVTLRRIDPTAAPPGGTLIDQHTSLLL